MAERIGKRSIMLTTPVSVKAAAGVGGHKEAEGPLGSCFDMTYTDDRRGQDSWEKAEGIMQNDAARFAIEKSGIQKNDIDLMLAGDLLNQCMSSTLGLRSMGIPFMGQYGACSTMAQNIGLAALLCDGGAFRNVMAVTSSHFCSAERQFRLPIEYGGQRTLTAQWTVTGAGAAIVGRGGNDCFIKGITIGRMTDLDVTDANNMGAAMAPAAADTIGAFFRDTGCSPMSFDLILTGDLGYVGSDLLKELLIRDGFDISAVHEDCGKLIFDRKKQDVHSGGSGCGCCASVFCSHIVNRIKRRELKNILFAATGAMMSPTMIQQGESIPGICHLVHITAQ